MKDIIYQVVQRDDIRELAKWLVRMSQIPAQHCLHTWSGQSAEELHQQLLSYWDDSELCYVVALRDGQLEGALGSEYDLNLERGWLHGPHVMTQDWSVVAEALYSKLLYELPMVIGQLDAFLNVENSRAHRFYGQHRFIEREHLNHEFWLTADKRIASCDSGGVHLRKEHEDSFQVLFETLFPAAYYSAERVIHMIGESHQVFVAAEGEDVYGFVVVSTEGGSSTGEIQFLGVREDRRRQGHGKQLLLSGINWLFNEVGSSRISLNVGEELEPARGLYESVGFKLQFTGVGLEKRLEK